MNHAQSESQPIFRGVTLIKAPPAMRTLRSEEIGWDPFAESILTRILMATVNGSRGALSATKSALFECTLRGPVLNFQEPVWMAVGGVEGSSPFPLWQAIPVAAGQTLDLRPIKNSCRIYLMFAAGGDHSPQGATRLTPESRLRMTKSTEIHVMMPEFDLGDAAPAGPGSMDLFANQFKMNSASDGRGLRLNAGQPLPGGCEIPPEPFSYGCIQLPPSGHPVIIGPEGPKTGGYCRLGKVAGPSLRQLAWLLPGDPVTFMATTRKSAIHQRIALEEALARDIVPC